MFGSILRRWRLAAPLALVALASFTVAAGTLPSASAAPATSLHFRFSGDAADFINFSVNPAFFDCFSGFLDPAGGTSIKSGLRDCIAPGFTYNHIQVSGTVGAWDVEANHSSKEGHALSTIELAGFNTGNFTNEDRQTVCNPQGNTTEGGCSPNLNNDTVFVALCSGEGNASRSGFCDDPTKFKVLVSSRDIKETSEAECQKNGSGEKVTARSQASFLDLFVRHSGGNSFDTVASAEGFDSVVITRTLHFLGETVVLIVTTNDHTVFKSGNHAAISGNGLRVIVQDGSGDILADVVAAHTHADIECSTHSFNFGDPIGA